MDLKELQKDLPQLIVALDSLDDSANYVHIKDAKEDIIYYCPCCKGIVKPRAYKEDKEYQVQAHFYHEGGGCNEETFIHYICKMWLFENGCKFKVNEQIYTVDKIDTEKTFHTEFGDYRPDITVYTEENKTFFFEIKNTNKKTENYIPKWDELENDVVEVDVRYFINQKVDSNIPEFKLIYSDGECFIKTYTRKDYDDLIAKRKMEWKRQDKLNYKMIWEKLDWFWIELQKYKINKSNLQNVIEKYSMLEYDDMDVCISIVKKMKCLGLYKALIPLINKRFCEIIKTYDIFPYKSVDLIQESPRIFYIGFLIEKVNNQVYYYDSFYLNGKFEYYSSAILKKFIYAIKQIKSTPISTKDCSHLHEIKELNYKRDIKYNIICRIYMREREYVSVKSKDKGELLYSYKYENSYNCFENPTSYYYLKRYIHDWRSNKHISRRENILNFNKQNNLENAKYKVSQLINMINNCKNKQWSASDLEIINTPIPNKYHYGFYIILNKTKENRHIYFNSENKYQIFIKVKNTMNEMIKNSGINNDSRIIIL